MSVNACSKAVSGLLLKKRPALVFGTRLNAIILQVYKKLQELVPTVAFYTLGCRLNFSETSGLARQFSEAGYEVVDFSEKADLYVVNTCTVTSAAEKKGRQVIHQAHRANPEAKVAVVGCFSELRPEKVAKIEGVDYVLGSADKHLLLDYVRKDASFAADSEAVTVGLPEVRSDVPVFVSSYSTIGRTRSFFKVQDGCDNFCTYCAIPYARGRSRSATIAETMEVAREIAAQDVYEIVLTGVNIGDFGRKQGETFLGLLQALATLDGVGRIRIGSVEPDLLSDEIIDFMASSLKLMPHFHIPLQSGNDEVLKRMHRHYDTALYADRVRKIREKIPYAFIACDIIAGFPTETAEQFEDSYRFVEGLDLSALHVFSYSDRPEAAASRIKPVYGAGEKAARSARLHALSDKKKERFYARFEGQAATVLWEADCQDGYMFGYTPNYLKVKTPYQEELVNTIDRVRLSSLQKDANKDWCFLAASSRAGRQY